LASYVSKKKACRATVKEAQKPQALAEERIQIRKGGNNKRPKGVAE
jgi:hypothetical protein